MKGITIIGFAATVSICFQVWAQPNEVKEGAGAIFPLEGDWQPKWKFGDWSGAWSQNYSGTCRGYHLGDDIGRTPGTPVYPTADGVVRWAGVQQGYTVVIEHNVCGEEVTSVYYHMKRPPPHDTGINLIAGQKVFTEKPIGYVSGKPEDHAYTYPHLHFGIRRGPYISARDDNTGFWYYPGYTTIKGDCNRDNPKHQETLNQWYRPADFINRILGGLGACRQQDKSDFKPVSAVAVVMDRSPSMRGEKLAGAKRAADSLFAQLKPQDYVSLVTFAGSARTEAGLISASPENKLKLQSRVKSVEINETATNITAGLTNALTELTKSNTKAAAYLLSDGMHNTGTGPLEGNPSVVQRFQSSGYPIHTIAYGSGSDLYTGADLGTLQKIAQLTGGFFWMGAPNNLSQVYHKINAHINNYSVLLSYNDMISQGKSYC